MILTFNVDKEKLSTTVTSVESPTIKTSMSPLLEDTARESAEEEDDDLFEDAMSDFPDQFPDHAHSQNEKYVDEFEESVSLNEDDGSQEQRQKQQRGDIKRSSSEQVLSPTKDGTSTQHRRWLSEDIKAGDVSSFSVCFYLCGFGQAFFSTGRRFYGDEF